MIKCLLVEDEPLAQQVLEHYIRQTAGLQLVNSCPNAVEAFALLGQEQVDLLFLDTHLPLLSGLEFIKRLKQPPAFIFTTAYAEYAAASYELEAVDYLVKPITYDRFSKAIAKYRKTSLPEALPPPHTYFKVNGKLVKVAHADLLWAQSGRDYLLLKTPTGHYITHMTMKHLAALLPATLFKRVHRSFLINVNHVTAFGKNAVEVGAVKIPIGDQYKMGLDSFKSTLS